MKKAIIFDMDGLMIETEHLQSRAFEQVLAEYGINPELHADGTVHQVGVSAHDNFVAMKEKYRLDADIDELLHKKQKIYREILSGNITPKPGLLSLLEKLAQEKVAVAVASSSSVDDIMFILKTLDVEKYFTVIVSGESVPRHKPAPDIFIEAARQLNVHPEDCVVLEDSQSGVEAAKAACMNVIAVPNQFTKSQDFRNANVVVTSLEKIDTAQILG